MIQSARSGLFLPREYVIGEEPLEPSAWQSVEDVEAEFQFRSDITELMAPGPWHHPIVPRSKCACQRPAEPGYHSSGFCNPSGTARL